MSYRASATAVGNSKGLRLEGALFREHPEFAKGEFEVDVIAPGRLLVRARVEEAADEQQDPVLDAFLAFLGDQMATHPQLVRPLTHADRDKARELVEGIEVDDDEQFDEGLQLP